MSADNWAICPQCQLTAEKAQEKALFDAGEAYGKVSPQEYLKMITDSKTVKTNGTTMREDYDVSMGDSGYFEVDYRCSCEECGFSFEYKHGELASLKIA